MLSSSFLMLCLADGIFIFILFKFHELLLPFPSILSARQVFVNGLICLARVNAKALTDYVYAAILNIVQYE